MASLLGYDTNVNWVEESRGEREYAGRHQDLDPMMKMVEKSTGLVHSESMHLTNDPRFFQDNVLNKRLAAFSGLSVVSGLMVGTSSDVISMKKDMYLGTFEGNLQLVSFSIMSVVLFLNLIATYVGVAQIYHTYRLETAGPTGFEMATSYYLNPNIVCWRHVAVKSMLSSLPLFLVSTGIRIEVNFERVADVTVLPPLWMARLLGFGFMALYSLVALVLFWVHNKHMAVFRENYDAAKEREMPYLKHVYSMMNTRLNKRPLDV